MISGSDEIGRPGSVMEQENRASAIRRKCKENPADEFVKELTDEKP